MAGIMDGFEAATQQGKDLTQAGASAAPAEQPLGTDVFGPGGYQFREAGYTTRNVDRATGTVSGQLDSILAQDGLHMQRARSNALQMAADMGLRNSSIAVGAAQGALIDRATPIATTDAQIYNDAARDNQQAANAAALANAGNYNQIGGLLIQERGQDRRLVSSQGFTASQSALDRAQQLAMQREQNTFLAGENQVQRDFQSGQATADRQLQTALQAGRIDADAIQQQLGRDQQVRIAQLQETGTDRRQAEQIAAQERGQREQNIFAAGENQVQRDFQSTQATADRQLQTALQAGRIDADAIQQQLGRDQQTRVAQLQEAGTDRRQAEQIAAQERSQREQNIFSAGENDKARQAQMDTLLKQHELTLAQMGYQSQLNNAAIPKQFAASIAQQTLDRISAIAGDGNLDAAAKKGAIQNIIDAANATAQLGAKLYGASIPAISMPGFASVAPVPYAPGTPAYYAPDGSVTTGQLPVGGEGIMGDSLNGLRNWRLEV